jgi:flagellar hook-basal body complex protein FliE
MSQMEIDRVLSQIRDLRAQAGLNQAPLASRQADNSATVSFASILKQGIDQVNRQQKTAASMAAAFERGTPGVDLPQVMIEMQKSSVSFRAVTEVRNRLVSAYQDIMNMPV